MSGTRVYESSMLEKINVREAADPEREERKIENRGRRLRPAREFSVARDDEPGLNPVNRKIDLLKAVLYWLLGALLAGGLLVRIFAGRGATAYQMRLLMAIPLGLFGFGFLIIYTRWSDRYRALKHEEAGLLVAVLMLFGAFCFAISFKDMPWPEDPVDAVALSKSVNSNIFSTPFCTTYHCSEASHRVLQSGETSHAIHLNVSGVHLSYTTDPGGDVSGYSLEFARDKKDLTQQEANVLNNFIDSVLPLGRPVAFGYDARWSGKQ